MAVTENRYRFRAVDAGPGIAFTVLYLLTLSRTLSVTHDSALFLRSIETLRPALVPNHLWFEPIMASAYQLMMVVWPDIGAQRAAEAVNALAGGLALQAGYSIAVWRVGLSRSRAALAVTCAGFTYGVWYYSIAIEAYALPLALTAWTFFGLTAREIQWRTVIGCAMAHTAAILTHQSAVLFGVVALGALFSTHYPWRNRLAHASAYALIVATLTVGAYAAAAINAGHGQGVGQAVRWSLGFLPRREFWSRPPRALVQAAMGVTRATVGGQFVYAVPGWATAIDRWFPRSDPVDERFFVRAITPPLAWLYAGFALLALASLAALLAMAAGVLVTTGLRGVGRETALLAAWLAMYCAFFTFWDSANPDFWVIQVFVAPLLAVAVMSRTQPSRVETALLLALAFSLLVVNGLCTVRLARDPANDYYAVYLRSVARELRSGDMLVLGDHWPIRTHLARISTDALFLSVETWRTPPSALAQHLRSLLESRRRVFVAPDIMNVPPAARASYGQRYVAYVEQLRAHLCGLGPPLGRTDEMAFREVTCVDGVIATTGRGQ